MLNRKEFEQEVSKIRVDQVNQISEYLAGFKELSDNMRNVPINGLNREDALKAIQDIPFNTFSRDITEVAEELIEKGFNESLLLQHPRCFAFVTSEVSPYSLLGAILADIYNPNAGGFHLAPTINMIEEKMISWMGSLAGFGPECGGIFTSGGSISNLTGCVAARDNKLSENEYSIGVAYISDQTHSSAKKNLRIMGLRHDQIVTIPTDDEFKMRPDLLEEAIKSDIANGRKPFLIVGTLGTTNTGSIDPLVELGEIKEKYNMWLHVDGAFGGSILFSLIYKNLAKGIENADSLSWDTHKWGMQGYSCSSIIARDKKTFVKVFAEHPEYVADIIDADHTDGWDMGIEMSRPARAVKLWMTVQCMGTDKLSDVIDYSFFNSRAAVKTLESLEDWEQTSPAMCGTVTFRYAPKDIDPQKYDWLSSEISRRIIESGFAYIVTTTIKNKVVLRMNMINGKMTDKDVIDTICELDRIAKELHKEIKGE